MRVNPISNVHYAKHQAKSKAVKSVSEVPVPEAVAAPAFKGKPLTAICGGLAGLTALVVIVGTGGAAAVALPALGFAAVSAGAGYALDKENEEDLKKENEKNK